jgi:hypothetical protein
VNKLLNKINKKSLLILALVILSVDPSGSTLNTVEKIGLVCASLIFIPLVHFSVSMLWHTCLADIHEKISNSTAKRLFLWSFSPPASM